MSVRTGKNTCKPAKLATVPNKAIYRVTTPTDLCDDRLTKLFKQMILGLRRKRHFFQFDFRMIPSTEIVQRLPIPQPIGQDIKGCCEPFNRDVSP